MTLIGEFPAYLRHIFASQRVELRVYNHHCRHRWCIRFCWRCRALRKGNREVHDGLEEVGVRRRQPGVRRRCHYRAGSPFATSRAHDQRRRRRRRRRGRQGVVRTDRPGNRTGAKTVPRREDRGFHLATTDSLRHPREILHADRGTRVCTARRKDYE